MVEKIVHYVWVGNKKSLMMLAALKNWKKMLPDDWTIMEWNETNIPFNVPFVKYWYDKKNFSFVSDYVRLFALSKYGGVYMDTDMFLKKEFPLEWLTHDMSIARTTINRYGMAFILTQRNNKIINKLMEIYELPLFMKKNNHRWMFNSILLTEVLHRVYGTRNRRDGCMIGNIYVIKHDEAGGVDFHNGRNVVTHMFGGSWKSGCDHNVAPGKYYYDEENLYKNHFFIKIKFSILALFLHYKYVSLLWKNKKLRCKVKELKELL
jgi:mannosyltransferase OCH1-like enzyme